MLTEIIMRVRACLDEIKTNGDDLPLRGARFCTKPMSSKLSTFKSSSLYMGNGILSCRFFLPFQDGIK